MMETTGREPSAAEAARSIMRSSLKASLATVEQGTGFPYASLVTVGHGADGSPLLLLSDLALHTRNLKADSRASLLFDASDATGDPLAGGRVTVIGHVEKVAGSALDHVRQRFLARQPDAQMYAGFADFSYWRMTVERAHYIGGFGRIVDLGTEQLLVDTSGAEALLAAEHEIVAHMNSDHDDALQLYATVLCSAGRGTGSWRMTGIDPAGLDLVNGDRALRLDFDARVASPSQARAELVRMAQVARSMSAKTEGNASE